MFTEYNEAKHFLTDSNKLLFVTWSDTMAIANIKNIDDEKYNKALFVIKSKGSNFAKEVKKMCDKYAEEFDKTYSK